MKKILAAAIALSLAASAAWANEALPAGKPAGVHKAQDIDTSTIVLVVAGGALIGAVVAVSESGGGNGSPVTTSSAVGSVTP